MEQVLALKLQNNGIPYQTQVEIPVTTADFYFSLESRPLLVFVDGRVHLGVAQMAKDGELRTLLRKRGYRILESCYESYSDKKRDQLYEQILGDIRRRQGAVNKQKVPAYILLMALVCLGVFLDAPVIPRQVKIPCYVGPREIIAQPPHLSEWNRMDVSELRSFRDWGPHSTCQPLRESSVKTKPTT